MITLRRAGPPVRWGEPYGESAGPLTWRPIEPNPDPDRRATFAKDLALLTCSKGHETRLSGTVHTVAPDGQVTPSVVCPVDGCGDHQFVRLEGWEPRLQQSGDTP